MRRHVVDGVHVSSQEETTPVTPEDVGEVVRWLLSCYRLLKTRPTTDLHLYAVGSGALTSGFILLIELLCCFTPTVNSSLGRSCVQGMQPLFKCFYFLVSGMFARD